MLTDTSVIMDQKYIVFYTKRYKCYCVEYELAQHMSNMPVQMLSDDFQNTNVKFVTALDISCWTMKKLVQWSKILYKQEINVDISNDITPDVVEYFEKIYNDLEYKGFIILMKGANYLGLTALVSLLKSISKKKLVLKYAKQVQKDKLNERFKEIKSSTPIAFMYMPLESMFEPYTPTIEEKVALGTEQPNNLVTFCKNSSEDINKTKGMLSKIYLSSDPEKKEQTNTLPPTKIPHQHHKAIEKHNSSSQEQSNNCNPENDFKKQDNPEQPLVLYYNERNNMKSQGSVYKYEALRDPNVQNNIIRLTDQLKAISELYKQRSKRKHKSRSKNSIKTQTDFETPLMKTVKEISSTEKCLQGAVTSRKCEKKLDNSDNPRILKTEKLDCMVNNKNTHLIKCSWCEKIMPMEDLSFDNKKITDDEKLLIDCAELIEMNTLYMESSDDDDKTLTF